MALGEPLLVQPRLARHGEAGVGRGAQQREVGAAVVEVLEGLLQLGLRVLVVSLQQAVDLVQLLLQPLHDLGHGVAGVHPDTLHCRCQLLHLVSIEPFTTKLRADLMAS